MHAKLAWNLKAVQENTDAYGNRRRYVEGFTWSKWDAHMKLNDNARLETTQSQIQCMG